MNCEWLTDNKIQGIHLYKLETFNLPKENGNYFGFVDLKSNEFQYVDL